MRKPVVFAVAALAVVAGAAVSLVQLRPQPITVDYPLAGAVFPPEFPPPLVEWRDPSPSARAWTIDVALGGEKEPSLHVASTGEPPQIGPIDERAVGPTNQPPQLTPERASAHTWRPDAAVWDAIKKGSTAGPALVTITGFADESHRRAVSRGRLELRTSLDPVGAPIFYRDVPLMPSKGEKGVIKPLDQKFVPLIAWRLRDVAAPESRVLLTGMHSCANCHSFSSDGKTIGMDLDGPRNDKGLYALFPVQATSTIRRENVIAWSTYRGKLGGKLRSAFMSRVSPDGRYVITTINDPGRGQTDYQRKQTPQDLFSNYYIANFTNYRFLQAFYPTRGILAWYSREVGKLQPLPGADDPRFVHTNAAWSPDGSSLVFARAEAKEAYPGGTQLAEWSNDPRETQVRYDLYRIPFDGGRGGTPVPIAGASANGMSNSFPKISPDGRFIVFVQAKNGLLMRPDSKLYIVPAEGGQARLMRCNTALMNSWHSFSPNGRWLVFSSKSRSPYTQLFLTHIDENGNDTPAVMIENSTAANRAANIPEFVNVKPEDFQRIDAPVTEYYRLIDDASDAMNAGRHAEAIPLLKQALADDPDDAAVHNSYGSALAETGQVKEALVQYRKAVELSPDYPDAHNNLASALVQIGQGTAAIPEFEKALALKPDLVEAHAGLGGVLAQAGRLDQAIPHLKEAVERSPDHTGARANLCLALSLAGRPQEAIPHAERAVALSKGQNPLLLDLLGRLYGQAGRLPEAIDATRRAIDVATQAGDERLARELRGRLSSYETAAVHRRS